jgi:glycosyltransferase involved in cell wall biosynthesis
MTSTKQATPKVTIAVPTCNRAQFLGACLRSALAQTYPNFDILVVDNASTDNTETVVKSFGDSRVRYFRNETNIGLFRNWNRTIELNHNPYLTILQDDDELLPEFVEASIKALDGNPSAAFSCARAGGIDLKGKPVPLPGEFPAGGIITGIEYLYRIVDGCNWVIHASTVMMRSSVLDEVGPFDAPHSNHSIDINLYYKMMARFNVIFIPELLGRVRLHGDQHTRQTFYSARGTGPLATIAERTDAIAHLLKSNRAEDASFRQWLADRLLYISMHRSELTSGLVPELNLSWDERLEIVKNEITALIADGETFILVDDNQWGGEIVTDRNIIPFIEHDGHYWGAPQDDFMAIQELERLRGEGVSFIVFGWPAFWWLDYYSGLRKHLLSSYRLMFRNSRLVVYDIREEDGTKSNH